MKLFAKYLIPSCFRFTTATDAPERRPSGSKVAAVGGLNQLDETTDGAIKQFSYTDIAVGENSIVIGEGGFSTVYLAPLPNSSASMAAFKVHQPSSDRLYAMFRRELDVLLRLRHPNIVRLIGYAEDPDAASGILVLEHVPHGTLHDMLHGGEKKAARLSWPRRASVACQLASALEYLHEGQDHGQTMIIHGDIKSSNVLLDGGLDAKLCDFGSARMGFSATVARSARGPMMGSPGYVDPHYLRTGLVTKKSDVYSFGVLLFELVTGKEAFGSEGSEPLAAAVRPRLEEIVSGSGEITMVDRRLGGDYDEAEVRAVVRIAGRCIAENPSVRPSMGEVLRIMREVVPSAAISPVDMRSNGKKNT